MDNVFASLNENIQNTNKLLKQSQNIIDEINNKDKLVNGHYQNIEEKKQQIDKLQSEFINNINTKQQLVFCIFSFNVIFSSFIY